MNERSGPASPLRRRNVSATEVSSHYGCDREHGLDRAIIAAVWRRERAAAGRGYKFVAPPLRRDER
jgi:hypothetical protein